MISPAENLWSSPSQVLTFSGLLFDMDGTIIDSTEAVVQHWHSIGNEIGVDPNVILQTSHGRRSIDILKDFDPTKANWDCLKYFGISDAAKELFVRGEEKGIIEADTTADISRTEGLIPQKYGSSATEIPGARSLISSIPTSIPWAIVTSGTRPLVTGWLSVLKLPSPKNLVVAEDVENGKPDPTCYLMGLQKLGLEGRADEVLVLEDSPAGIRSGKNAGCKVLAVVTSHTLEQVVDAGPDWIVRDLTSVRVVDAGPPAQGAKLEIKDALLNSFMKK